MNGVKRHEAIDKIDDLHMDLTKLLRRAPAEKTVQIRDDGQTQQSYIQSQLDDVIDQIKDFYR